MANMFPFSREAAFLSLHKLTGKACSEKYLPNTSCLAQLKCHHTTSKSFITIATIMEKRFSMEKFWFSFTVKEFILQE